MSSQRRRRTRSKFQARIFGGREPGRGFSEYAITFDIRQNAVKRSGVKAALKIDEIIGLARERNKVHFGVKSTGKPTLGSRG